MKDSIALRVWHVYCSLLLARFIVGIQKEKTIHSDLKMKKLKVVGKKGEVLKTLVTKREDKHFSPGRKEAAGPHALQTPGYVYIQWRVLAWHVQSPGLTLSIAHMHTNTQEHTQIKQANK